MQSQQRLRENGPVNFLLLLEGMPRMSGLACITTALRHTTRPRIPLSPSPLSCSQVCVISPCCYPLIMVVTKGCKALHEPSTRALHRRHTKSSTFLASELLFKVVWMCHAFLFLPGKRLGQGEGSIYLETEYLFHCLSRHVGQQPWQSQCACLALWTTCVYMQISTKEKKIKKRRRKKKIKKIWQL